MTFVFVGTNLFLLNRFLENVSSDLLDFSANLFEVVNQVFEVFGLLKRRVFLSEIEVSGSTDSLEVALNFVVVSIYEPPEMTDVSLLFVASVGSKSVVKLRLALEVHPLNFDVEVLEILELDGCGFS